MTRPGWAKRELVRARGAICERCGAKPIRGYKWLHLDHVVPLIDGGTLEEQNLQLLCPECHLAKTLREQAARLRRTRLVVLRQLANRE